MYSVTLLLVATAAASIYGYQNPPPAFYVPIQDAEEFQGQYLEQPEAEYILHPLIRHRRQLFGGLNPFPSGGFSQTVGYRGVPAWASISQNHDILGFSQPITYSGGMGYTSPAGNGAAGSFSMVPGIGGSGSLRGELGLLNTPNHQIVGWAEHSRNLDKDLKIVGPETNSAGLTYTNLDNGAGASVSATKTPGQPLTGSVSGNIPLFTSKDGKTSVQATGSTNVGQGMKPDHEVGVKVTHEF